MKSLLFVIVFSLPTTLEGLASVELSHILSQALIYSPYLKMSQHQIEAKEGDVQIARAKFLPHFQGEAGRGRQSKDNYYTNLQKRRFKEAGDAGLARVNTNVEQDGAYWNVTVQQDIFKGFGNVHNFKEKARLRDISEVEYRIQKNSLIYEVLQTYVEILNLQSMLSYLEEAQKTALSQKQKTDRKFELETISKSTQLKAHEELLEIEWKSVEIQKSLQLAKQHLDQLVGIPMSASSHFPPLKIKDLKIDPLSSYLEKISKNLDLTKNELTIAKDRYKKRLTYAQHLFMPNLGFEFNYEKRGRKFTDLEEAWKLGFVVKAPLFDGLENFGEQAKARAALHASQVEKHVVITTTELDIKKNYFEFESKEKQIQFLQKKRERLQKEYDQVLKSFNQQAATKTDIQAAEVKVREIETQLLETKRNQFLNFVALQKLTGDISYEELF
ncbi:MAG: TolC family protein [Deltaproteobacteria bacterium]|nr:TolC family protein [Deltaproteobacteria bacterium]